MTKQEAISLVRDESYEPESYAEAVEVFAALYERKPDAEDGTTQGELWSHCCAYSAAPTGTTIETLYLIETMPEHLRESHRAARNWGRYPANGAERSIVGEADLPAEDDEYDHVVRVATERDVEHYGS